MFRRINQFAVCVLSVCTLLMICNPSLAQDEQIGEMELIERVAVLQRQLESQVVADRDAAEKELIELGPSVLDSLEPTTEDTPSDAIQRTARVRKELETIAVARVTQASKVTLKGTMTVKEALAAIKKQTSNDVAMPDETPDQLADHKIELNHNNVDFWVAVADVMKQGSLVVDPYAGQPGQLRLTPTPRARIIAANPGIGEDELKEAGVGPEKDPDAEAAPSHVSGIFDLQVVRVNSSRNLANPELNYCNLTVLVRWEPRIRPISIDLPASTIKAIDEYDNPIDVPNPDQVMSGIVQPEIPELEFSIPIGLVDRQIEVINSFEATIDAVLPGRTETFRFKKIGKLKAGNQQSKAGAIVTFGGIQKNEDLFGVTVKLSFEEGQNALESHQGWAFNNPVFLEDADGKKHEAIAYETLRQDKSEISIQFYFENDPQDMTLVYQTAAAIVEVPIKVLLKVIPLP